LDRTKQTPHPNPTADQFGAYGLAFDYFNSALFGGCLPRCILNFSRRARSNAFFGPDWWSRGDQYTHEISLNPDGLNRPLLVSMSGLVHEMVHEWQHHFGKPSRRGYHNAEWADKMEEIGLMPAEGDQPGGRRTGQGIGHYVIKGGAFDKAFQAMPPEYQLPWISGQPDRPKRADKVKYTCVPCKVSVWGKAGLHIICGDCRGDFLRIP
jgi:hypothetical protein